MATIGVQFTGTEPMEMPGIGAVGEKAWQPPSSDGSTVDARELDEALATLLLRDPDNPFKRVALKVARAADTTPEMPSPPEAPTDQPQPAQEG